jgi:Putative zinc dependent peptidase (DUF5700)
LRKRRAGLAPIRACARIHALVLCVLLCAGLLAAACSGPETTSPVPAAGITREPVSEAGAGLAVDATAAEAVLAILEKERLGQAVTPADWSRLFDSDAYRRLLEREMGMNRPFDDESFRDFVLSPELAEQEEALAATLAEWRQVDLPAMSGRVAAYLPEWARLRGTVYPMIKPQPNSFVFDLEKEPAIFLYLDPAVGPEKFANTVLHELHHIGFGTACPPPAAAQRIDALPEAKRKVLKWMGAFGEGFAMLAAAGGADVHPHAVSPEEERQRWDRDVARFAEDRALVEAFFQDLLAGRLDEEAEMEKARSFYGVQGPWYTVGWKMAVTIEEGLGRSALIEAFCDPRRLLPTYNHAATQLGDRPSGTLWSEEILAATGG